MAAQRTTGGLLRLASSLRAPSLESLSFACSRSFSDPSERSLSSLGSGSSSPGGPADSLSASPGSAFPRPGELPGLADDTRNPGRYGGKMPLGPQDLLRRLYQGDPAVLRLGRGDGNILVNLLMHMKPSDVGEVTGSAGRLPELRPNEEWVTTTDRDGNEVVSKQVHRMVDELGRAHGAGTRKTATASAWVRLNSKWNQEDQRGCPTVTVNGVPFDEYFKDIAQRKEFLFPLFVTDTSLMWDIEVQVEGGGFMGQAGAAKLALARAMQKFDPSLRPLLRMGGCLTVDPRRKERKKPGKTRARKSPQWSKR